jgi:hypothetical protein
MIFITAFSYLIGIRSHLLQIICCHTWHRYFSCIYLIIRHTETRSKQESHISQWALYVMSYGLLIVFYDVTFWRKIDEIQFERYWYTGTRWTRIKISISVILVRSTRRTKILSSISALLVHWNDRNQNLVRLQHSVPHFIKIRSVISVMKRDVRMDLNLKHSNKFTLTFIPFPSSFKFINMAAA